MPSGQLEFFVSILSTFQSGSEAVTETMSWTESARQGIIKAPPVVQGMLIKEIETLLFFKADFISSNWKYFHDAAKKHRLAIIDDILPRYGICVA